MTDTADTQAATDTQGDIPTETDKQTDTHTETATQAADTQTDMHTADAQIESDKTQTATAPATMKVVLLGDSGVGKTCLRSQFIHRRFSTAHKATISGDYLTQTVGGVRLQVWDTAGQERFNSISRAFYRNTDVVVLVYDITNYESLLNLRFWFKQFVECAGGAAGSAGGAMARVVVVGNKTDREAERRVDREEVRELLTRNVPRECSLDEYMDWGDVFEVCGKLLGDVQRVFERVAAMGGARAPPPLVPVAPTPWSAGAGCC